MAICSPTGGRSFDQGPDMLRQPFLLPWATWSLSEVLFAEVDIFEVLFAEVDICEVCTMSLKILYYKGPGVLLP